MHEEALAMSVITHHENKFPNLKFKLKKVTFNPQVQAVQQSHFSKNHGPEKVEVLHILFLLHYHL